MKHYTLRTLIHDAKVFNQLRREYRRTKKNRGTSSEPDWRSRCLAGMRRCARAWQNWFARSSRPGWFEGSCGKVGGYREYLSQTVPVFACDRWPRVGAPF